LPADALGWGMNELAGTIGSSRRDLAGLTLDLWRQELRDCDGKQIELRNRSFSVQRHLAPSAGRVVTKDELLKANWQGVTAEDSLTQGISEIRRALGDDGLRGEISPSSPMGFTPSWVTHWGLFARRAKCSSYRNDGEVVACDIPSKVDLLSPLRETGIGLWQPTPPVQSKPSRRPAGKPLPNTKSAWKAGHFKCGSSPHADDGSSPQRKSSYTFWIPKQERILCSVTRKRNSGDVANG
jgi:hypothetical protein